MILRMTVCYSFWRMKMKFDFVLGEVEELLEDTNIKLSNIEMLLEMILTPPDVFGDMKKKKYKKRKTNDD